MEEEQLELGEFQEACALPQSEGVAYAVEKLAAVQANVKEQFRDVFLELKQALEVTSRRRRLKIGLTAYRLIHPRTFRMFIRIYVYTLVHGWLAIWINMRTMSKALPTLRNNRRQRCAASDKKVDMSFLPPRGRAAGSGGMQ